MQVFHGKLAYVKSAASPLRYPGGKSRAAKHIVSMFPVNADILCSPFFGGGSVELLFASEKGRVFGYDAFLPLINFWQMLLKNPEKLADRAEKHLPLSKEKFYYLQKHYKDIISKAEQAAVFYVLNRASFSGATLTGGMSPGHPRFTASSIERIRNFKTENLSAEHKDFTESIPAHPDDFLYCDPPYANKEKLYGIKGDMHSNFNHEQLAEILRSRDRWLLSYNDCERVRKLYSGCKIVSLEWAYGMNRSKLSNEIIIKSEDF